MEIILERLSIKNDPNKDIDFSDIDVNKVPVLLIYEMSKELHGKGIIDSIIEFLIGKGAEDFERVVNTSIYFNMDGPGTKAKLKKLNQDFETFITEIEQKYDGKIFWVFNYVGLFTKNKKHDSIAMVGRGNLSLYQHFIEKIKLLIIHLKKKISSSQQP